jgi:hypothetical protein
VTLMIVACRMSAATDIKRPCWGAIT